MLAAYRDTGYNVVLFLHILSVMAAFAPTFVHPFLVTQLRSLDAEPRGRVMGFLGTNGRRYFSPALILAGVLGFALQGMSDDAIEFGQTWFWLAALLWVAMVGIIHGVVVPAERAMADGDQSAEKRLEFAGIALTLLMLVTLYLMVFKPGL